MMVNNGLKHLFQLWYRSKELPDGQTQTKFAGIPSSPTYVQSLADSIWWTESKRHISSIKVMELFIPLQYQGNKE